MTKALESWLGTATRRLAKDSVAQVTAEIQEHFESSRDAAINEGRSVAEAETLALNALGDPKAANVQYRQVLLTRTEARMLRDLNWEAFAVCSRPWIKGLILMVPAISITVALGLFLAGHAAARDVLIVSLGMSPLLLSPLLPIYPPSRSRVFRLAKWFAITAAVLLVLGPAALQWSWLLISCLWPMAWTERTRAKIRRKLPVTAWPKHLYL